MTGDQDLGELRNNLLTGRWSVVAPGRSHRPFDTRSAHSRGRPRLDPACPFCPGNEAELPEILWEMPSSGSEPWAVRAVPNRYPAFVPSGSPRSPLPVEANETFRTVSHPATGRQEVIIETPRHDLDPAAMDQAQLIAAVEGYHARYGALSLADPAAHVILFRNRGAEAGNSLIHAHAQAYAVREPVPDIERRTERALRFHARNGDCLLCAMARLEPEASDRTVAENEDFVARVPWAPATSLEVWILPKRHQPSFGSAGQSERRNLAALLGFVFRAYRERGGDPSYNAIWHSARLGDAEAPHLHWFVQLRPRLARPAGYELTAGVDICPSDPVADAALLRG